MTEFTRMLPDVAPPSQTALLEGRGRLVAEARDEAAPAVRRRPGRRRRINPWTVLTAGLVAGAMAVSAVFAAQIGGTGHQPSGRVRLVNAAEVLSRASATARADAAAPHGKYFHYRSEEIQAPGTKFEHVSSSGESWVPVSGYGRGLVRSKPCDVGTAPDCDIVLHYKKDGTTDREGYSGVPPELRTLPSDPGALLAQIRRTAKGEGTVDDRAWKQILELISDSAGASPRIRAALFAAAAKIPGVVANMNTRDALGRPGISVARSTTLNTPKQEIVLDRGYRLIGDRTLSTGEGGFPPGTVLSAYVLLHQDVVDQLPPTRPGLLR